MATASPGILRKAISPIALALALAGSAAALRAAPPERGPELGAPPAAAAADAWIVSTRGLPSCSPAEDAQPQYWRLNESRAWTAADEPAFLAADQPSIPTVVFIHGNRYDSDDAAQEGIAVCRELSELAPGVSFRYVIWSWPADRIRGNRNDVRAKFVRSEVEALYLARFLSRLDPDVSVCLIGHSYGAHTILGALRLTAGGSFAGHALPRRPAPRPAVTRAVLLAAATDQAALAPCAGEPSLLGQIDRILVTVNGCDPVLKYFPRLCGRGGPEALGYAGPAGLDAGDPNSGKVEVVDVTWAVGKNHGLSSYQGAPPLRARLAWYAFLERDDAVE
jgi:esterase/lipase superfamily enzyme